MGTSNIERQTPNAEYLARAELLRRSEFDVRCSMVSQNKFWRSLDELARTEEFAESLHREFPPRASEWLPDFSRRHFLKILGASVALAGATSCTRQPAEKIVPYVKQPEEIIPGKPLYFATAMTLGGYAVGLLATSYEGHPTKIEGNPDHPMSLGATNVFHQASLLDLYDPDRARAVTLNGEVSTWEAFLSALHGALQTQLGKRGAGVRILTETITSPTLHAQIQSLLEKFPEARWHQFEPINRDNPHDGSQLAFGELVVPQYHFDKARVVLSLDADFMFSHAASLRYARDFTNGRRIAAGQRTMNRLYVVESTPTITGSNADSRTVLPASEIEPFTRELAQHLDWISGVGQASRLSPSETNKSETGATPFLRALVADLQQNRGASIVIAGERQPPNVHALAYAMNHLLGNEGMTVHYTESGEARPVNQLASLRDLNEDLKSGAVELLVVIGGNPAFTAPADFDFADNLSKARLRIHLSAEVNETSVLCQWHVPQNHYLESWSDARAFDGTTSIVQPLILPLYAGKSAHELLDAFLRQPNRSDYDIVRDFWQSQNRWPDFEKGWRRALHDGLIADSAFAAKKVSLRAFPLGTPASRRRAAEQASKSAGETAALPGKGSEMPQRLNLELTFHPDASLWDGRFANNGWLQETPRPITKLTWDNAALISPALANREKLSNGDVIELTFENRKLRVPVWIAPGQAENSIALHLGYGRTEVGRVGKGAGFNAYSLRASASLWSAQGVTLKKTSSRYQLATTQMQRVIDSEDRQIYREGTFEEFSRQPEFVQQTAEAPPQEETLYHAHEHDYEGYRWGMAIDLTACIGCNACVLACYSENNIPVVGKDQVLRGRDMQWLRIDTYFSGNPDAPEMRHQPVPCMHCENAPCELVCPVGATLHDKEGLNLQVYNRCVGTRYCSNNCPYKVRRFNFYQYADYDTPSLKPMRNPNVTVRWRGVMEKCTYCIQRISAARIQSKIEDRNIGDGEVKTACQQVCPTEAIIFGDLRDPNSRVSKLKAHPLNYAMLGQLNTRPRTTYLAKLRNPNPQLKETALAANSSEAPAHVATSPPPPSGERVGVRGQPGNEKISSALNHPSTPHPDPLPSEGRGNLHAAPALEFRSP